MLCKKYRTSIMQGLQAFVAFTIWFYGWEYIRSNCECKVVFQSLKISRIIACEAPCKVLKL